MSIIRSNIARQLLAEGGAPRASFRSGGQGRDRDVQMSGVAPSTDYSSFGPDQEDDNARMMSDMGLTPSVGPDRDDDDKALSYVNFNRPTKRPSIFSVDNFNPFPLVTAGLTSIDKFLGKVTKRDKYNLSRRTDFLRKQGLIGPGEEDEKYTDDFLLSSEGLDMLRGMGYTTIQDVINNRGEGGDSQPIKRLQAPITEKIEEKPKLSDIENLLRLRGSAFEDGGEVRQEYGLGSIVKKATRAVKKVAKSPLGKAALIAGIGAYGLGAGPFAKGSTMFGGKLAGLKGSGFLKSFLLKDAASPFALDNISPFGAITAASLLAGAFSKQNEEEEDTIETAKTDPQFTNLINYYGGPRRFAEDGGDIDEAPMKMASNIENDKILESLFEKYLDMGLSPKDAAEKAKEEFDRMSKKQGIERTMAAMGGMMEQDEMLNLGGNEMDLRGGGFVPIGEYEKKDDVPARLSKNEFVFTADAVRAAGGGSVDKGADLMYKTMKTLENKVA